MPKATLEFTLPEENPEFAICNNASRYYCAVLEVLNFIRSKMKYEEISDETDKVLEELRTKIFEELDGASLDY